LAGDLDGIISAREPAGFLARDPKIARLWPEYRSIEEEYYRETGVFPIMHAIVVKAETLSRHPWVAMNLLRAFEEAKTNSLRRLSSIVNSSVAIPWAQEAYHRAQQVLGEDFWPYGIEGNRRTLEAFLQYCREQGVTQRTVSVEELFPREVTKAFSV
jgi:4,5-dihydroxyphthalate decarboxylase